MAVGRRPRFTPQHLGQHELRASTAADVVRRANLAATDFVIEIGAGRGVLTRAIAERAGHVRAIEIDPRAAASARRRLCDLPNVSIVQADFLALHLPRQPFRVVANIPFGRTTAILRRLLDDPRSAMRRADLIVQWGAAKGLTAEPPDVSGAARWTRQFRFRLDRRLGASCFVPRPSVDAALLVIERRQHR